MLHTAVSFLNFRRQAMVRFRHLALIFLFLSPAVAADQVPLEGEALLGDEYCAVGLQPGTCILSFRLRGKAAKLLFDGLRDEAQQEECTGSMEKSGGNGLYCHAYTDGTYLCEFGYLFSEDAFSFSAEDC
jgi:hypothetical protein